MSRPKEVVTQSAPLLFFLCVVVVISAGTGCTHKSASPPIPPAPPPLTASAVLAPAGETKISPSDAQDLFREVDEILKFANQETNLPIRHAVKRKLASRDEVTKYLEKSMREDKDAQRLQRSELVLKKFGLLPRDFDLQTFLLALLREQVAGYYDPKTKTVNLLDWVDLEQQRPVLAHELTHALQDQSFHLEKWMNVGNPDLYKKKRPSREDIDDDELNTARQAVVEGQAMVTLVDYTLAPTGQSLKDAPQVVQALKAQMLAGTTDSAQYANAPIYLKESLTFPYRYGLDFEVALLISGGKQKAFAGAFANPPRTTRQIMEPQTYLSGEKLAPMPLPDFERDFKDYEAFDIGAVGEFDTAVLLEQYGGTELSQDLHSQWRGGYYYAGRPKADASAPLALLYVSAWSSGDAAAQFAAIYARSLAQRYKYVSESEAKGTNETGSLETVERLAGKHFWRTEEGTVEIEVAADQVFICEGLDQATSDRLEREVLPEKPGAAPQS